MFKRMDVFYSARSQYGVLDHFTHQMYLALKRLGIKCRMVDVLKEDPLNEFLDKLIEDPPECTLSFNGLLPNRGGHFLADHIKIPHIACIVDSPHYFLKLTESTHTIVTCPDQFASTFFTPLFKNPMLFMPHAIERDILINPPEEEKIYPVLMLASCIDYQARKEQWKFRYPLPIYRVLKEAAKIVLGDQTTPFVKALATTFEICMRVEDEANFKDINSIRLLDELEKYVRGVDRAMLIRGIKDAPVHVYGAAEGDSDWAKCLGDVPSNVILNSSVSFVEAHELMKRSKIVLNSCPTIKAGSHERILSGIASGALVITSENPYLKRYFKDGESIVFYQHGHWDEVNEKVNYYLTNEHARRSIVEKGREIVLQHHTWDHRANELIKNLTNMKREDLFLPAMTFSRLVADQKNNPEFKGFSFQHPLQDPNRQSPSQ